MLHQHLCQKLSIDLSEAFHSWSQRQLANDAALADKKNYLFNSANKEPLLSKIDQTQRFNREVKRGVTSPHLN